MIVRFISVAASIGAALTLAACDRQATGQVAAVVGDEEVTLQEINTEIGNAQLPKGVDVKAVRSAALQRIVDRRLLAEIAREDGVDEQPDYLIRKRQLEDALLVQLLGEKAGRSGRVPAAAALDKFIASRPRTFARREILTLDQIRFPLPADANQLRSLEEDHSMEAVAAKLAQLDVKFQRGSAQLDTAQVAPALLARIEALPASEPFVVPANGLVTVSVIVGRRPAPLSREEARPVAVQMMRSEALDESLKQRLKAKKAKTKISYQPGFAPPKPAADPVAKAK